MKLTDSTKETLTELSKKHPEVKELLDFYTYVTGQSAYEGFVARLITLKRWDADLINNPVSLFSNEDDEEKAKARDKEVDRVLKYLEKQTVLYEQTDDFLTKLTGDEQEALNRDKRIRESEDRAFRSKGATK